jgi:hypothetical protein
LNREQRAQNAADAASYEAEERRRFGLDGGTR